MHSKWEESPVLLLALATAAIGVGTIVTMVLPFWWANVDADRIEAVTPYTALQNAGRDVYVREGCNNCHTQTIRPLVAEVARYGPYSKSGEFRYDRPFLWGSRRMGPDLARIGGKYPDEWHVRHFTDPRSFVAGSNMPDYAFFKDNTLDPADIQKRMDVLGFPYEKADLDKLDGKTEMDAMVAYMQKMGADIDWIASSVPEIVGELKNPLKPEGAALARGEVLFQAQCAPCHGRKLEGDIGMELTGLGVEDAALFRSIWDGLPDANMPPFHTLGKERIWHLVTYVQSKQE